MEIKSINICLICSKGCSHSVEVIESLMKKIDCGVVVVATETLKKAKEIYITQNTKPNILIIDNENINSANNTILEALDVFKSIKKVIGYSEKKPHLYDKFILKNKKNSIDTLCKTINSMISKI